MESTGHVSVPLRTGKKMKKRKELDALVANSVTKRTCVASKRATAGGGISSQDQLLSESTDDQEYWIAGATKRPRTRLARRRACGTLFRACSAVLMFACVVATTTVLWLFIDVREQITALRSELDQVVASSQGVPDALQKCHTISKNLQQNQTVISIQLADLKLQMENLSKEVASMQSELNKIQEKFNNAPEYLNIPQQISEVSGSVANLGSQIKDLTTTVTSLKDYKGIMETTSNVLMQNVTDLRLSVSRLQNLTQVPVVVSNKSNAEIQGMLKAVEEIKSNVSSLNSTLSNKLQWVHDDQVKDHKTAENLMETWQNMSARVTTLENICGKCSSDQIALRTNVNEVSNGLTLLTTRVQNMASQIPALQSQYRQLSENSSELQLQVKHLSELADSPSHPTSPDTLTTIRNTDAHSSASASVPPTSATSTTALNSKPPILDMS